MANTYYDELISTDWLGRSKDDYTYEQKGLDFGWRSTLTQGEPFSNFIIRVGDVKLSPTRKITLVKQACEMLKSRMLIGKNENVRLTFVEEFDNYATKDKDKICVTLEPMATNDPNLVMPSFNHALDPILGYLVHEMAHIVFTEESYFEYLMKFKDEEAKLKAMIMNIIEDERIENLVAQTYAGYTPYVGKAKDYCFGKKYEAEKEKILEDGGSVELSPIEKLANTFINLVRYPKALTSDEVNTFENEIREFQKILSDFPKSTEELIEKTELIYEVFKNFFEEQEQDDSGDGSDEQDQQQKSQAQSGGGNVNSDENGDGGSEDADGSSGDDNESRDKEDGKESSGAGDSYNDDNGKPKDNKKGDGSSEKALEKALESLINAVMKASPSNDGGNSVSAKDIEAMLDTRGDYLFSGALKELDEMGQRELKEYSSSIHTFVGLSKLGCDEQLCRTIKASEYKSINYYEEAEKNISMYASSLRAKLQELNRNVRVVNTGLHEGDFDGDMITDAIIGAKNVYREEFDIANQGATIGLLVDESGSMDSYGRYRRAMEIAVLFEKALRGVNNIDFYCYGHTTANYNSRNGMLEIGSTLLNIYFEGRKRGNPKDLGLISADNGNNDGLALVETISRIRTFEKDMKKPIILFMVSDGEPSAPPPSKYNGNQVAYLKACVDEVEKTMNAQVIHVAIEGNIPSEKMYNSYVKMTDYSTLVRDLGGLLKKIVTKQQSNVITI